jgi:hypothetical protein
LWLEIATSTRLARGLGLRLPFASAAALLGLLAFAHATHASNVHHAALLIEHSSGRILTRCVSFLEDQISGFQLVQRSGVEYQAQPFGSMGEAICQLDYEPQPVPSNCLGTGAYWQYYHRTPGGWTQSSVGASTWMLHDGDMDGWHYAAAAGQPPNVTYDAVCGAPSASVTAAPTRTSAPAVSVAAASSRAPSVTATVTPPTPSPSPSPSLEALAPTLTPTAKAELAVTSGSANGPPPPSSAVAWLLLLFGTTVLVGLAAVNLLRRGP